ncbi:MAG: LysE family translocator [Flavobacteriales bacterium]|nr:LysE family translocator [Flavobacteriales bacterium]
MDPTLILGFILATAALAFMPGPDNIYVLTESISKGVKQGVAITTGLISGVIVHTTLVATGLSLLVFSNDLAYDIMKYAGTAYLLYMAFGAVKEAPLDVNVDVKGQLEPFPRLFKRGFLMNVLNPKVTLFFIVLLPQFVSSDGWSPMYQMFVLGGIFMAVSLLIFSSIAVVSGYSASLIKHPLFWVITKWVKVMVLLALATFLLLSVR